jgi:CRISPR-associated protein Cas1
MVFENEAEVVSVPFQTISAILLGPGTSVTHDAMRLAARHGVALVATGSDGARCYTAPPLMADSSKLARQQAQYWASPQDFLMVVNRQFSMRFDTNMFFNTVEEARGAEGVRVREAYKLHARMRNLRWERRNTGRVDSLGLPDDLNIALNHASSVAVACASIAVTCTATIPQLGFLHEDSGKSWVLDIADLYKTSFTIPAAFDGYIVANKRDGNYERHVRKLAAERVRDLSLIDKMIADIEKLLC